MDWFVPFVVQFQLNENSSLSKLAYCCSTGILPWVLAFSSVRPIEVHPALKLSLTTAETNNFCLLCCLIENEIPCCNHVLPEI